jgi:hypothetical protein
MTPTRGDEGDMRKELFDQYEKLSFSYYDQNNSGQMMSKLVSDLFDAAYPDTLLYLRATYKLTNHQGEKQEVTQTFYLDKGLTRVIGFKEN